MSLGIAVQFTQCCLISMGLQFISGIELHGSNMAVNCRAGNKDAIFQQGMVLILKAEDTVSLLTQLSYRLLNGPFVLHHLSL